VRSFRKKYGNQPVLSGLEVLAGEITMSDDSLIQGARKQYRTLEAAQARLQANLAEYIADGNEEGIAEELGNMTILELQKDKLGQMYDRHIQSQQPRYREPDTEAEFKAKTPEKMGWDDGLKIVNYGKLPGDPTIVTPDEYNRQIAALRRHKANGKYVDGGN
jgi:hypothetical protein